MFDPSVSLLSLSGEILHQKGGFLQTIGGHPDQSRLALLVLLIMLLGFAFMD
jgi:hypothetical protein